MDISLILQDKYLAKGWAEMQAAAEEKMLQSAGVVCVLVCIALLLRFPPGLQASPGAIRHDDEVGE